MFYETMLAEYQRLDKKIAILQEQINTLPLGTLVCTHNGKYQKWYYRDNERKLHYIRKTNTLLAQQLARKKYLSLQLSQLNFEKKALESYLHQFDSYEDKAIKLLDDSSRYKDLLETQFSSFSDELTKWISTPYECNPKNPERLIHKTLAGHMVRSKSEALIDTLLYINKIPFRYESPIYLDGIPYYPDFMIRHPQTGNFYIWEHFGLMDDDHYIQKTRQKLHNFINHGYLPSVNLIITMETKDNPLTSDMIEKTIHYYFGI